MKKQKLPPIENRRRQAGKTRITVRLPHVIHEFVCQIAEAEGRETPQEAIEEILRREMLRTQHAASS